MRWLRGSAPWAICLAVSMLAGCSSSPNSPSTSAEAPIPQRTSIIPCGCGPGDFAANVGDRLFFDADSSNLTPESRAQLDGWIRFLKKYPMDHLILEGHTDERSTREYNLALGERRADAAKDYLIAHEIKESRLQIRSYGKERPEALGHDEAAWAQNRRVVGVVTQD